MITLREHYQVCGQEYRYLALRESAHTDFLKKHGIKTTGDGSVGFSEKEQKWYGWSHRAIYGFKIGDKVKKGDVMASDCEFAHPGVKVGFKCKDLDDCKMLAKEFAKAVA